MSRKLTARAYIVSGLAAAAAGCASVPNKEAAVPDIRTVLDRQAAAWNAGDVESFMDGYWRSPQLTFSSAGHVTRGWQPTLEGYKTRYPTRSAMGRLTFSDLEITMLGRDAALVLGRWRLDRDKPVGGTFTLVFRRIDGRWVIVHDHTSKDAS